MGEKTNLVKRNQYAAAAAAGEERGGKQYVAKYVEPSSEMWNMWNTK